MRYRRYYGQRNPDGSATVVSIGPLASCWFGFVKIMIVGVFLTLPLDAIYYWRAGGVFRWVIGIPAEILWLALIATAFNAATKGRIPPK